MPLDIGCSSRAKRPLGEAVLVPHSDEGTKIIELLVCEKGIKFDLVQKLEKYMHKIFEVLIENTSISVSIF